MLQATWHNVTQHTVNVSIDSLCSVVGNRLLSKNMKFPGSSDLDLLDLYLWIRYCEYKISSFDWSNISSVVVIMTRGQLQRTDGVHPTAVMYVLINWLTVWHRDCLLACTENPISCKSSKVQSLDNLRGHCVENSSKNIFSRQIEQHINRWQLPFIIHSRLWHISALDAYFYNQMNESFCRGGTIGHSLLVYELCILSLKRRIKNRPDGNCSFTSRMVCYYLSQWQQIVLAWSFQLFRIVGRIYHRLWFKCFYLCPFVFMLNDL